MTKRIIKFEHVVKKYGKHVVIPDLSFSINEGEFVTVLGSSGCGKTTTLKMINGLVKPTRGNIIINGKNLKDGNLVSLRRHVGYVIQSVGLFPHMTIAENIGVTPKLLGWSKDKIAKRVADLLKIVGLNSQEYEKRYPAQLSGGQQQRVGVARALSTNPPLLLFDEPFSALDAITRQKLQKEIKTLHRKLKSKTFFFVTHDINEALYLGDRVIIMNHGKIEQFASPKEIVNQSATPYVKELMKTVRTSQAVWEAFK